MIYEDEAYATEILKNEKYKFDLIEANFDKKAFGKLGRSVTSARERRVRAPVVMSSVASLDLMTEFVEGTTHIDKINKMLEQDLDQIIQTVAKQLEISKKLSVLTVDEKMKRWSENEEIKFDLDALTMTKDKVKKKKAILKRIYINPVDLSVFKQESLEINLHKGQIQN